MIVVAVGSVTSDAVARLTITETPISTGWYFVVSVGLNTTVGILVPALGMTSGVAKVNVPATFASPPLRVAEAND